MSTFQVGDFCTTFYFYLSTFSVESKYFLIERARGEGGDGNCGKYLQLETRIPLFWWHFPLMRWTTVTISLSFDDHPVLPRVYYQ